MWESNTFMFLNMVAQNFIEKFEEQQNIWRKRRKTHNKFAGKTNCEMKTMESALQIYTSTFNVHLASNWYALVSRYASFGAYNLIWIWFFREIKRSSIYWIKQLSQRTLLNNNLFLLFIILWLNSFLINSLRVYENFSSDSYWIHDTLFGIIWYQ